MSEIEPAMLDWPTYFQGASWFHITGITSALSHAAAQANLEGARAAKAAGLTVCCDLNFRAKLWDREKARRTMEKLMEYVDVCFGLDPLIDLERDDNDEKNRLNVVAALRELSKRFGFKAMGLSLRTEHSASRNGWQGLCFTQDQAYWSRPYEIEIVERVGTGDSFTGGFLYGLISGLAPQETVEFATAASCLKHTILGDMNLISKEEVFQLIKGDGRGRIQR
jgi:2-dehydro-3-deoxygluconokinase